MKQQKEYPKIDGHRKHYVLYPVQKGDNWRAAEVVDGGYIDPFKDPSKIDFNTKARCKKACDAHNSYHGWDEIDVIEIITKSMSL